MGMKTSGGGEIIQVQGGHIVRSTGRKDRHSKVYTSKGPRDRRVRLSAYTAIQFYDVQDRLGYDRPSKAVDWLIKKAQSAIEKLAELPPWHPIASAGGGTGEAEPSAEMALPEQSESSGGYNFQLHNPNNESSYDVGPPSLDHEAMKSFFPTSSSASSINFQSYPVPNMIPRTNNEDLCLSLHSFQDHHPPSTDQMSLFSGGGASAPVSFDANFQRMVSWSSEAAQNRGAGAGFIFGSPPQMFNSHREPLQSSFASPSGRAWDDISMASADHRSRFGLPEFCLPPQIHGQDQHGAGSDKPSFASPSSHH